MQRVMRRREAIHTIAGDDVCVATGEGNTVAAWKPVLSRLVAAVDADVSAGTMTQSYQRRPVDSAGEPLPQHEVLAATPSMDTALRACADILALRGEQSRCDACREAMCAYPQAAAYIWHASVRSMPGPTVRRLQWQPQNLESRVRASLRIIAGLVTCATDPSWSPADTDRLADAVTYPSADALDFIVHADALAPNARPGFAEVIQQIRSQNAVRDETLWTAKTTNAKPPVAAQDVTTRTDVNESHAPAYLAWLTGRAPNDWIAALNHVQHQEDVVRILARHAVSTHGVGLCHQAANVITHVGAQGILHEMHHDNELLVNRIAAANNTSSMAEYLPTYEQVARSNADERTRAAAIKLGAACRQTPYRVTGMHTAGWTDDQRIAMLTDYAMLGDAFVELIDDLVSCVNPVSRLVAQGLGHIMCGSTPEHRAAMRADPVADLPACLDALQKHGPHPHRDILTSVAMQQMICGTTDTQRQRVARQIIAGLSA